MRMKVFHAESMPEAIRLVRGELGENAIIVSSQRGEGGNGIRVTAAVEGDEPTTPPPVDQPQDAIEAISDALHRHGCPAALSERLLHAAAPLAEKLLRAASALSVDAPVMTMAAALDALFEFDPLPERGPQRPVMLIGPPGSGKTVTVAKLAARAVLTNRAVNVITTDTMRAGGIGQLQAFTRILDIDLQTALDPDSLGDALTACNVVNSDALTLIDTAGANPFDSHEMEELIKLVKQAGGDTMLVLPAGYDCEEAADIALAFGAAGATRLLVTRLDAARRLGSVLVAADTAKLKFSDLSVTPHVADGLNPVNPVSLARLLIPEFQPATSVVALYETARQ
jgi:flagellar biosynthesis protein FlhF